MTYARPEFRRVEWQEKDVRVTYGLHLPLNAGAVVKVRYQGFDDDGIWVADRETGAQRHILYADLGAVELI
jgi:hypothetical protein